MPANIKGDVLILAGDIINLINPAPLAELLKTWGDKPVVYIPGNHEFYHASAMDKVVIDFRKWLVRHLPQVHFLQNETFSINGVHFFGGTMWTDFQNANPEAMEFARSTMNDFWSIFKEEGQIFTPQDSIELHQCFVSRLIDWFKSDFIGPRIVVTHHAPVIHSATRYHDSLLRPAFNSLDMKEIIQKYQPDLWVYGHTHECDGQLMGKTKIISNQLGYRNEQGIYYECPDFDVGGKGIELLS